MPGPIRTLRQVKQKLVPQSASPKKSTLNVWYSLPFSSPGRSWGLEVSSQFYGAVLRGETMVNGCHEFSYLLWYGWFHTWLGCRDPLNFSQGGGLVHLLFLSWCIHGKKESLGLSILPSCYHHLQSVCLLFLFWWAGQSPGMVSCESQQHTSVVGTLLDRAGPQHVV